jgi:hypothetical protein
MKIYITVDCDNFEDDEEAAFRKNSASIIEGISTFLLNTPKMPAKIIAKTSHESIEKWKVGIECQMKKTPQLDVPLTFFNALAKEQHLNFVVGIIDGDSREDICYFGFHEGLGDAFTLSQYLGL